MKAKLYIFATVFLIITINCISQTAKTKKTTTTKVNEIDRLFKLYETAEGYTFTSVKGKLPTKFEKLRNSKNKPFEISMLGTTTNYELLKEIVYGLLHDKLKKGYKSNYPGESFNFEEIDAYGTYNYTLIKGNYYFKISAEPAFIDPDGDGIKEYVSEFKFTNGDISRISEASTKTDF
ncbi:MAG: hypothetical protein Q8M29_00475 [Bacteroidota bacterium]|nr:hypothetical protein [Bacteroidota bacterium]